MGTKYIITDLDGTLLNANQEISKETIDILIKFQENGNRIVFASGRNDKSIYKYSNLLLLDKFKGATIQVNGLKFHDYDDNEKIENQNLSKKEVYFIVLLSYLLLFRIYIVTEEERYQYPNLYIQLYYIARLLLRRKKIPQFDWKRKIPNNAQKIELAPTFFFRFFLTILKPFMSSFELVEVSQYWVEIMPKGTNKANLVKYYIKKYSIDPKNIYIFGDGENDIEMLKLSDNSYVPMNGKNSVKKIAKHICDYNTNDGVAKVIKKLLQSDNSI